MCYKEVSQYYKIVSLYITRKQDKGKKKVSKLIVYYCLWQEK